MGRMTRWGKKVLGMPGSPAALVSLAASVGTVAGVRGVMALDLPSTTWLPGLRTLLRYTALPREAMGLTWTRRAVWPDQLQAAAVERIAGVVAALFLAAASVALLNALVLLLEAGAARRREMAIRAALGAPPVRLLALLFRQVRVLLAAGGSLGLLLGLVLGGAVRSAWPGSAEALGAVSALATTLPALGVLLLTCATAYLSVAWRAGWHSALAPHLTAGGRATEDRGEAFRRRALSAVQMGGAGAVALGSLAVALAVTRPADAFVGRGDTVAVAVTAPASTDGGDWEALLARLGRIPGMEAESLSTPGAVLGFGVRDHATSQCGACVRGTMAAPFWGAVADHHAVAPGYFDAVGLEVSEGRSITAEDVASGRKVALVNRTFAAEAFEKGEPLGHLIRLGRGFDDWYEVVGVVEDADATALGRDDMRHSAVWMSAFQQPPARGDVLLRGPDEAVQAAVGLLEAAGFDPETPRTLGEEHRRAAAPLVWVARVAGVLGLLTLLLALHGSHTTTLQVTRRRVRELAIRRALGAGDGRLVRWVLAGAARTALWGAALAAFFGTLFVGLIRQVVGGVPAPGPGVYLGVTALLVAAALAASARAAREAVAVEPATVME